MAGHRCCAAVVTVMIPFAFSTTAAALLEPPPITDEDPKQIQLTVVALVEVAASVDRRAAKAFREYVTRERPPQRSAFGCFKLVGAKSMRDAKAIARQKGARFILRVQLLRRVVCDTYRDPRTKKMANFCNSDMKLEFWMPATYRAAPANTWKARSRCMARNYNSKSPGLMLMDLGNRDDTDEPDTPFDFSMLGDRIIAYLRRSVFELKKVTVARSRDGSASARIEVVNHANIPATSFTVSFGQGFCRASYDGKPLPPGENSVTVPLKPTRWGNQMEKVPANGPCKGKMHDLSFGWIEGSAAEEDAEAGRRKRRP